MIGQLARVLSSDWSRLAAVTLTNIAVDVGRVLELVCGRGLAVTSLHLRNTRVVLSDEEVCVDIYLHIYNICNISTIYAGPHPPAGLVPAQAGEVTASTLEAGGGLHGAAGAGRVGGHSAGAGEMEIFLEFCANIFCFSCS